MQTPLQHNAFLLLLALVTGAFCWLLLPFFGAVFWAVILAIIFAPLQRWLEVRLGRRRNLAAALSVIACLVIAIIPMSLVVSSLVAEGARLLARVQSGEIGLPASLDDLRAWLPDWAEDWLENSDVVELEALGARLASAASRVGQFLAARALTVGQDTLRFIAGVGIMLYVLFFLFRDGRSIGRNILAAMPLSETHSRGLLATFAAVVRATVKGNIIIAIIQGTVGGVTFWLLGIEAALLWGALMTVLSLLPAIGSALVWAPAAAYLILTGSVAKGIVLIAVGAGVIGLIDNLLRPSLVGKDTRLPDYVILVSTVGGLSLFGINGFVIGPLIAAFFVAAWTVFRDEQKPVREAQAAATRRIKHDRGA